MVLEPRKMVGERVQERIGRLETLLGERLKEEEAVATFVDSIKNEFEVQCRLVESSDQYVGERIDGLKSDLQSLMDDYQNAVQSMGVEIAILKKAMAQCPSTVSDAPPTVCVP